MNKPIIITASRHLFIRRCHILNIGIHEARMVSYAEQLFGLKLNDVLVIEENDARNLPEYQRILFEIELRSKLP
jgi:hypothetical protein